MLDIAGECTWVNVRAVLDFGYFVPCHSSKVPAKRAWAMRRALRTDRLKYTRGSRTIDERLERRLRADRREDPDSGGADSLSVHGRGDGSTVNLEKRPMNLTIDLSEQNAAALEAQARAARMPAGDYFARIVARALERQHRRDAENLGRHPDYMASQVAPDTTTEEMEAALQEALMQVRPHRSWHL